MGLLSALGAGGALAAERSHFTHFITATAPQGRRQGVSFRRDPRAGATALKTMPAAPRQTRAAGGNTLNGQRPCEQQTGSGDGANRGESQRVYVLSVQQEFEGLRARETIFWRRNGGRHAAAE